MRALWRSSLFPGCLGKQYSTDTSHSGSIYLEPEKFNVSLILNFICQKCYPHPAKYSSHSHTAPLLHPCLLGQVDIKQLLNRDVGRASEMEWLRIYDSEVRRLLSRGLAEQNHYQEIRSLDPELLTGSVPPPILGKNPERSIYRSSNVRDEAHPLRDSCCTVEPGPIWEDHQENSASGNATKPQALLHNLSLYESLSSKTILCKDCQEFLITES